LEHSPKVLFAEGAAGYTAESIAEAGC
jgi:hypothetical protein